MFQPTKAKLLHKDDLNSLSVFFFATALLPPKPHVVSPLTVRNVINNLLVVKEVGQ
jgi:hypothetical protein